MFLTFKAERSVAERAGSESGALELLEAMAEVQRLQEDVYSLREAMGSAEAETRQVEMDGNTEVQRLQELVESLSDELGVLRGSAVKEQVPSKGVADMRVMMEGLEREQVERLVGIEQL